MLVYVRQAQGLSQARLAQRARVSVRTICNAETWATSPRHDRRRQVMKALRLPWHLHRAVFDLEAPE